MHPIIKVTDMAKAEEKRLAFLLFTKEGLNAKEISQKIGVTQKTTGKWIKDGEWKKVRDANQNQTKNRLERIQAVIDGLSTERIEVLSEIRKTKSKLLEIGNDINETKTANNRLSNLNKEAVRIDNGIAMWNKTLLSFYKETKISLSVYIEIQNKIFEGLRRYDETIYMKTLEFQQQHILEASEIFN